EHIELLALNKKNQKVKSIIKKKKGKIRKYGNFRVFSTDKILALTTLNNKEPKTEIFSFGDIL
ncbi:unnamed protein product, partial [marine sediment metagenome]